MDRLVRAGYVDDGRFAARRAAVLADRGFGDEAIRFDLVQRGVVRDDVEQAVAGLDPEAERARRLTARFGSGPAAVRALARKGFAAETIELVASERQRELG